MRRAWWVWLCGLLLLTAACEVDEGEDGDAGADAGVDVGPDAAPGPTCGDETAWSASCLSTFFACFDASGTCTVQNQGTVGTLVTTAVVWTSGAEWEERWDNVTGQLDVLSLDSEGVICANALSSQEEPDFVRDLDFTQLSGSDTLRMQRDASGNMVITCPDGSSEPYSATEAATMLECLGALCEGQEPRDVREP